MASLFDGIDDMIDARLGLANAVGKPPRYSKKANMIRLLRDPPSSKAMAMLFDEILEAMTRSWEAAGAPAGSDRNWRFEYLSDMDRERNMSAEKTLEKAIPKAAPGSWANQVPVAAGLARGVSDNKRAIDLVERRTDGGYDFIELKIAANKKETPLRAAFEILNYGLAWVFCRRNRSRLACTDQPLVGIDEARLVVLANARFYWDGAAPYPLGPFELLVNEALRIAAIDYHLKFAFERFGGEFHWSATDPLSEHDLSLALRKRELVYGR